jgi:TRAP-type C4-dicarboxylate transport system permease small subunit
MSLVKGIWNILIKLQSFILITTSILIVLAISATVFFRYVFEIDLFGMEEIIVILAFWLYFIGGSYGAYEKSHISADMISTFVKSHKLKSGISMIVSLITMVVSIIVTAWGYEFNLWTLESGARSTSLQIPIIVSQSAIFIGFILMSLYFIVHFIQDTLAFFKIMKSKEAEEGI